MLKLDKIVHSYRRLEREAGMPRAGKDEKAKAGDVGPLERMEGDNETFGEALSRAGFASAKVGHRVVSQGRPRETLKKRDPTDRN
jgi:hypothetical protein